MYALLTVLALFLVYREIAHGPSPRGDRLRRAWATSGSACSPSWDHVRDLDGFDLGAGAIHLVVARSDGERRLVLRSIGPVWDGNEVWLIAAGGTLYFAFPALYAASFSGFYLPLMIVLWLLMLRGIAIEFRSHVDSPAWTPVWDVVFSLSSLLLVVFYGAALGNVMRGVPLTAEGWFFEPLWTDLRVGPEAGSSTGTP